MTKGRWVVSPVRNDPDLDMVTFRLLGDLFLRHAGLQMADESREMVARKLAGRLPMVRVDGYPEYYRYLRFHPAEMDHAIEAITTKETYLFRESAQLDGFEREVLPGIHRSSTAQGRKRLLVWSAGCATGEEVYTLASIIEETGLFHDWDVKVLGTDVARKAIGLAREGVYGPSSFRAMPARYDHYFETHGSGRRAIDIIRDRCRFTTMNLVETERMALVGTPDVIFCRNVLIYMAMHARRAIVRGFSDVLRPGGYLLLGHSESLINISTSFSLVHLSKELVYRKSIEGTSGS
ncbi:MAG: protein-glutamate O-methyltransferase CheR [Myxococcales bacterium]|nr:protein-glutamate O-methyltransferase CheR [Myxococcales bacterium]